MTGLTHRISATVSRLFPERRLFLRSDTETRYIRLTPGSQAIAVAGSALLVGWSIFSAAVILMDTIGSGSTREQARRDRVAYEERLNTLAADRDLRAEEARRAQDRFNAALAEVSAMQSALLAAEDRANELEDGVAVLQATLGKALAERNRAREEAEVLAAQIEGQGTDGNPVAVLADTRNTLDYMAEALGALALERDLLADAAMQAESESQSLLHEAKLLAEKNNRIFSQLEDAMTVSLEPLNKMFDAAGLPRQKILDTVRQGYSGLGGPVTPISLSTKGSIEGVDEERASAILERLDELNIYRIAIDKAPFGMPVRGSFRYTSGFGSRWGRMHEGTDLAGATGTAIHATADGVVIHADWLSGYGRLVKIKHEFGIETRYAHLSKIDVKVGQRVSRGDRIGAMGNSGNSTGTHLHYEVRIDGKAVNPMTYIKAANDVL